MKSKLVETVSEYLPFIGGIVVALVGIFIPKRLNRKEKIEADKIEKDSKEENSKTIRKNYESIIQSQKDIMENLIGEIHALKKDVVYLRKSEQKLWKDNQALRKEMTELTERLNEN